MFVRTERLFLRPAWPEDIDDLVSVLRDGERHGESTTPLLPTAAEVSACLKKPRNPRLPYFFTYLRTPGGPQLVGSIGLTERDGEVEVDYWTAVRHRGRGFAAEALKAVLAQARIIGHRRVIANDPADGAPSQHTLQEAGFRDTGEVRSRYSVAQAMEYAVRVYVAEFERRTGVPSHSDRGSAGMASS